MLLQVQNAISRTKKEATVAKLVHHLETSALCFGVRFKYVGVRLSIHVSLHTAQSAGITFWPPYSQLAMLQLVVDP